MPSIKLLVTLLVLAISVSCGRIDPQKSLDLIKDLPVIIEITVDISGNEDPELFIVTKEFEIDREKKELTIKGAALISSVQKAQQKKYSYVIKIENAKFSLPLGGKITITKDGKTEVLEQY